MKCWISIIPATKQNVVFVTNQDYFVLMIVVKTWQKLIRETVVGRYIDDSTILDRDSQKWIWIKLFSKAEIKKVGIHEKCSTVRFWHDKHLQKSDSMKMNCDQRSAEIHQDSP
jgi:hypothetical protein